MPGYSRPQGKFKFGRSSEASGKRRAVLPVNAIRKVCDRPIYEFARKGDSSLLKGR
jgi:hypothetical protein